MLSVLLLLTVSVRTDAVDMHLMNAVTGIEEPLDRYIGKGRWVIINVWSPDCSACVTELPRIKEFIARNPDIPVLGITLDFPSFGYGKLDVLRDFIAHTPLNYPLFLADIDMASQLIGMRLPAIPLIAIYHPNGEPVVRWPGVVEIAEIENYIADYTATPDDPLTRTFD